MEKIRKITLCEALAVRQAVWLPLPAGCARSPVSIQIPVYKHYKISECRSYYIVLRDDIAAFLKCSKYELQDRQCVRQITADMLSIGWTPGPRLSICRVSHKTYQQRIPPVCFQSATEDKPPEFVQRTNWMDIHPRLQLLLSQLSVNEQLPKSFVTNLDSFRIEVQYDKGGAMSPACQRMWRDEVAQYLGIGGSVDRAAVQMAATVNAVLRRRGWIMCRRGGRVCWQRSIPIPEYQGAKVYYLPQRPVLQKGF